MVYITRRFKFDAAHHLPYYDGKCHNIHGHTYHLDVTIGGVPIREPSNPKCGMVMDFHDLNTLVKSLVIDKYDHQDLNQFFGNPTAEVMVQEIAKTIGTNLPHDNGAEDIFLQSVKLWETEDSYAEWVR